MSFTDALYKLVLGPLELLFDAVYTVALRMVKSPGLALIFLSLAINLLVLPMYRRADALQLEESEEAKLLQPGVAHIKRTFRGDERMMMLQTYYRQNGYRPWYALKGSLSLLLQIPFFIAAYNYLSALQTLQGASFGPIADLGVPDGLLRIGGLTIHLLPVLMTAINIVSGVIYTRGMPLKSKLQLYGMALVFLALLYDSPSGLVFYWTLNNVFSLVKNILARVRGAKAILKGLCSALGLALLVFFLFLRPGDGLTRKALAVLAALALQLPLLSGFLQFRDPLALRGAHPKADRAIFITCCALLAILTGLLIPSEIVNASPDEFVELRYFEPPIRYVVNAALLGAGTFLVWGLVFYRMASPKGRAWFSAGVAMAAGVAVADYMFFGKDHGNLSAWLIFDDPFAVSLSQCALNAAAVLAVAAALYIGWRRKPVLVQTACLAGCLAVTGMAGMNIASIQRQTADLRQTVGSVKTEQPVIPLDRSGKNVVVLMLDRAINGFVPFMLNEIPGLQAQFDGFTYYPNTISYGYHTNVGTMSLFGGYEYIPDAVNARADVSLKAKHNEALKLMPVNFLEAGYDVTVCDLSYANYKWTPDLSIFDAYPGIHAYNTQGAVTEDPEKLLAYNDHVRNRNLFCYSLLRAAPVLFQKEIYNDGRYNEADAFLRSQAVDGAGAVPTSFLNAYMVMKKLPEITRITDTGTNTFLSMANDITHGVVTLKEPEYEPGAWADNTAYEKEHAVRYAADGRELRLVVGDDASNLPIYQVNMAAFIKLGKWFDYLRAEGVYDNTRIILVADHGFDLGLFGFDLKKKYPGKLESMGKADEWRDTMSCNPLLMVKDFNATGFTTDGRFMTHADTPLLAFRGLIPDPVNPFTGNPVTDAAKDLPEQHIIETEWRIRKNKGKTFADPVTVTLRNQNIFDIDNWTVEGVEP